MNLKKKEITISEIEEKLNKSNWILQNLGEGWFLNNTKPYTSGSYKITQLQVDKLKKTGRYKVKELSRSFQLVKVRD